MYLVWYLQIIVAHLLSIQCVVGNPSTLNSDDNENAACIDDSNSDAQECIVASSSSSSSSSSQPNQKQKRHFLTPTDLPSLNVFNDFSDKTIVTISNSKSESKIDDDTTEQEVKVNVTPGSIQQLQKQKHSNNNNHDNNNDDDDSDNTNKDSSSSSFKSEFALLPEIVPRSVIEEILTLLRGHENATLANGRTSIELNNGPDSVDGYTTQEFYLDNDIIRHSGGSDSMEINSKQNNNNNNNDGIDVLSEDNIKQRKDLRKKLHSIMDPYQDKITKVLHSWLHEKCADKKGSGRSCTPCYSLIRRYRAGERQSHAPHIDGHSFVTVVVSLSDYGTEYTGGLFVSTNVSDRKYIPLNRGDGILHQGDLHHGVRVLDQRNDGRPSERWSWIMWFRDSETCQDHKSEWYESCPGQEDGNPICTYLQATAASPQNVLHYLQKASNDGHPQASVKLGWAYLKALQSELPFDIEKAKELFLNAIESSNDPDGHYGLSTIYLAQIKMKIMGQPTKEKMIEMAKDVMTSSSSLLLDAIYHLEEAAKCGHVFAMFNLGIAAFNGYGRSAVIDGQPQPQKDPNLAAGWFEASGLPEGLAARSLYEMSIGNKEKSILYEQRAKTLGYGSSWRKEARQKTGSGGFVGANLNLQWPPIYPTGETPQEW